MDVPIEKQKTQHPLRVGLRGGVKEGNGDRKQNGDSHSRRGKTTHWENSLTMF